MNAPASIEAVEQLVESLPGADRLPWFESLPDEVQDAFWQGLADECASHREACRVAVFPEDVEWHRRPRVGRLWNVPKYRRRPMSVRAAAGGHRGNGADVLLTIAPATYVELLTGEPVPPSGALIVCPLPGHDDRTPSFKVYEAPERGWYCFGCHRGGSVIDLAAELWSMDPRRDFLELRRRIAATLLGEAAA